ncbi:MAG: sensor histidine kinase [Spirochaetaceae bacterium]|jgi:two-component system sensor histidine kinase YesM|nr:sensor histidine kinase [Spirochaetaceae bacterium]
MSKLFSHFMNQKLRIKLMLSFVLMAMIPLIIYTVIASGYFLDQANESAVLYTQQMTSQVSSSISLYIKSIENLANYLAVKDEVRSFLKSGTIDLKNELYLQHDLNNLLDSQPEIAGILLVGKNDNWISAGISRESRDSGVLEDWYQRAVINPHKITIISTATGRNVFTNDNSTGDDLFFIVKAVIDDEGFPVGIILLDITHTVIEKAIEKISIYEKGFVFVYDQENRIVYTPVNPIVHRVNPLWLDSPDKPVIAKILGETYQIESSSITDLGWEIVGVFSVDEIRGSLNRAFYVLLIVSLLVLFLFFIMFNFLTKTLVYPLIRLKNLMSKAAEGDFSIHFNRHHKDEVGDLGDSFNVMIEEINNLIQMVYKEQHDKQEAQLKSLQEQIKPHFLYNTLDTINWMARDYGAHDIVKLIDALTTMFRVGLSHGHDIITVQEELSHASNYLYIQGIRYKEKIRYKIDIPETFYNYYLPKLILQPLIENSIYHGLKTKPGGGEINIFAEADEHSLFISVSDNGAGINSKKLDQIHRVFEDDAPRDSFGLYYVHDRIRLLCGEKYGVEVSSEENIKTTIRVSLPLIHNLEEVTHV